MVKGDVMVGEHLVIKRERLHDAKSNVVEKLVEETRRTSRNVPTGTLLALLHR
jgi:hypothetical protein